MYHWGQAAIQAWFPVLLRSWWNLWGIESVLFTIHYQASLSCSHPLFLLWLHVSPLTRLHCFLSSLFSPPLSITFIFLYAHFSVLPLSLSECGGEPVSWRTAGWYVWLDCRCWEQVTGGWTRGSQHLYCCRVHTPAQNISGTLLAFYLSIN